MHIHDNTFTLQYEHRERNPAWVDMHNRAIRCAKNLKVAYSELLESLIEIEKHEIYFRLNAVTLHEYCVDVLLLPTHTAYDFTSIVRVSKAVPELAKSVIDGKMEISKARRLCAVITPETKQEWLRLGEKCNLKTIQRAVAKANPRAAVPESQKYVAEDVIEITFAVSEKWSESLADVKNLLSQKERRAVSTEEALFILMSEYKAKNDPVKRAERAKTRADRKSAKTDAALEKGDAIFARTHVARKPIDPSANSVYSADSAIDLDQPDPTVRTPGQEPSPESRYRPMSIEHQVDLRDQNQCVDIGANGQRCSAKRWLEKHHIVPFAEGGEHTVENLETLCTAHHRLRHRANSRH